MSEKGNRLKDAETSAWFFEKEARASRKRIQNLESALAQQADDLLAYQDYYGTSVAQVRHLQECYDGCGHQPGPRCPDYPTE